MVIFTAFAVSQSRAQSFNLNTNNSIWTTNAAVREPGSEVEFSDASCIQGGLRRTKGYQLSGLHLGSHQSPPERASRHHSETQIPCRFRASSTRLFNPFSSLPPEPPSRC